MKQLLKTIPIIHFVWLAALVAAFFAGRATAPKSVDPEATFQGARSSRSLSSTPGSAAGKSADRRGQRTGTSRSGDPAADILSISKIEDPVQRARELLALIERLGVDDFEAVVAAFRSLGITPERMADYHLLLAAWARVDPLAALASLEADSGSPADRRAVLTAWALDDPNAAIEWAVENFIPNGEGANNWLVGTIRELTVTDPDRATDLLNRLPQSVSQKDTRDVLNFMLGTLFKKDVEATMEWVSALPDEDLRAGAARRIAMRLAGTNPQQVARWAETLDPKSRRQVFEELTQPWALRAPDEALAWADTLSGDTLQQVAGAITPAVAAKDPQKASKWLAQFDDDPAFDTARLRLVQHLSRKTPELAADWLGRITDVTTGEREFHRMLDGWMERDPEAVLRYVENNTIPESIRQRAMRTLADEKAPTQ
ncbi:MAG: hypothetical protein P8M04_10210 [Akkermansiaceae bacterium]|nr:hypothetical protein [Akkermansiaceae bacterium]